jgi:NAD-dependent SIR2 family protein deacetylase
METKREYPTTPCEQCGYPIRNETITKAKQRGVDLTHCESCRAKPAKLVGLCKPFQGDLDENLNPVVRGKLFMPGVRNCGFLDCVKPAHVVNPVTGKLYSFKEPFNFEAVHEKVMRELAVGVGVRR